MSKMDFSDLIEQHVNLSVEDEQKLEQEEKQEEEAKKHAIEEVEEEEAEEAEEAKEEEEECKVQSKSDRGKLTKAEVHKAGNVASESYKQYIWNGGVFVAILVLLFHILSQTANVISFWWLTYWTSHPDQNERNIGIYAMLVGYVMLFCQVRNGVINSFLLLLLLL